MPRLRNNHCKRVVALALGLLASWPGGLTAQEVIRSDTFLERATQDPTVPSDSYSRRQRVRLPWIESYEYRTETNEFDPERQEHALRLSPSSPGLQRARSRLAEHYQNKRSVAEAFYRHDRIEAAFQDWKDLYVGSQQLRRYNQLEAILADRLTVRQKQLQTQDGDVKKLLDMRERYNDVRVQRYELELSTQRLRERLGLENTEIDFNDMAAAEQILLRLEGDTTTVRDPDLMEYRYDRELLDRELALEKAEKRQYLDFVQVRYRGPHDEVWDERVQLRLGFALPTSGGRNLKMEEIRLEQEELAREQQVRRALLTKRATELRRTLRDRIRVYQTFEQIKDEEIEELRKVAQALTQRQGSDPDLLLKLNEETKQLQLDKLDRLEDIYDTYLDYLALTGELFAEPLQNYLAN